MNIRNFTNSGKCNIRINGDTYSFNHYLSDGEDISGIRTNPKNGVVYELHGNVDELPHQISNNFTDFIFDGYYDTIYL